jgi:DNA-binding GntR family transcriptional regulator
MANTTLTTDLSATVQRAAGISDQVTTRLRELILNGVITETEVLTEATLATKLGVSRTPVREALARLENDGLVEAAGLRGKRIRQFTSSEIRELYWLRITIEGAVVAELAARKPDRAALKPLETLLEEQRLAAKSDNRPKFLEIDHAFHSALVEALEYNHVNTMLRGMRYTFDLISLKPTYQHKNRIAEVLVEHQNILKALRNHNAATARKAMTDHLKRTEELTLVVLEKRA